MTSTTDISYIADAGVHGTLFLDVRLRHETTSARGVLLDVLVLQELEHLTQSLEDVFEHSLEWRSIHQQVSEKGLLELTLDFVQESLLVQSRLNFPVASLPKLASWKLVEGDNLRNIYWRPVQSNLCLSKLHFSAEEHSNLGEGSLVMIPESFQNVWSTTLQVAGGELELRGEFLWPGDSWLQQSTDEQTPGDPEPAGTHSPDGDKLFYRVQFECHIDPVALMQRATSVNPGLSNVLTSEQNESELWLQNDSGDRYRGQLMALGSGQAMLLEQHETAAV